MKSLRLLAAVAWLLPASAFGWGADYAPGQSIGIPDGWPPALVAVTARPSRVAGYFINSDDYFAFRGDAVGLQALLDALPAMSEFATSTLHLHQGKGTFQPLDKTKQPASCDWQIDVINLAWRSKDPKLAGPKDSVELHVWLGGDIDLAKLQLPPTLKTIRD